MTLSVGEKTAGRAEGAPIAYRERTRDWYLALGYGNPYRWAEHDEAPFAPMARPLASARVAIVTTAAPAQAGKGDQGQGAAYNSAVKFYAVYAAPTDDPPALTIAHIAYDRTHARVDDVNAFFPLAALKRAAAARRIGSVAPLFYGLPTNRSQRTTEETDAPDLVRRLLAASVDAAILAPNCPVCHQCATLAARQIEAAGVATVVMGAARDIVESAGAPRFLFSDMPLGNGAGRPFDRATQDLNLALALDLLETAPGPRTTRVSPVRFAETDAWKRDFMDVSRLTAADIAAERLENDRQKAIAKAIRDSGV